MTGGAAKTAKKGTNRSSGGSGTGGGDGNTPPPYTHQFLVACGIALMVASLLPVESRQGTEISWQEFCGDLLESGQVDRIIISNKTTAR